MRTRYPAECAICVDGRVPATTPRTTAARCGGSGRYSLSYSHPHQIWPAGLQSGRHVANHSAGATSIAGPSKSLLNSTLHSFTLQSAATQDPLVPRRKPQLHRQPSSPHLSKPILPRWTESKAVSPRVPCSSATHVLALPPSHVRITWHVQPLSALRRSRRQTGI